MSEDKEQIRLTDLALDVFEDELACWIRMGTHEPKVTRLVRDRVRTAPLGMHMGTEVAEIEQVQWLDAPDKDVNSILVRIAMDKVVGALRREFAI